MEKEQYREFAEVVFGLFTKVESPQISHLFDACEAYDITVVMKAIRRHREMLGSRNFEPIVGDVVRLCMELSGVNDRGFVRVTKQMIDSYAQRAAQVEADNAADDAVISAADEDELATIVSEITNQLCAQGYTFIARKGLASPAFRARIADRLRSRAEAAA